MKRTVLALLVGLALPGAAFIFMVHAAAPPFPAEVRISQVEGEGGASRLLTAEDLAALPSALSRAILDAARDGSSRVEADASIARAVQELGASPSNPLLLRFQGAALELVVVPAESGAARALDLIAAAWSAARGAWDAWT